MARFTILSNPMISSWSSTISKVILNLFLLPFIAIKLGDQEFANWLIILLVFGLVQLSDSGFTLSFVRVFARQKKLCENESQYNKKIYEKFYKNYLNLSSLIFPSLAIVSAVVTSIVYFYLTEDKILNADVNIGLLAVGVGLYVLFSVLNLKYSAVLQGMNRLHWTKYIEAGADVFRFLLACTLLLLGFRLASLVILWSLSRFLQLLVSSYFLRRLLCINRLESFLPVYNAEIFHEIWSPTWRQGLIQIGGYFINNGNALVISKVGDLRLASAFLLTQRLVNLGRQISQAPLYANLPSIVGTIGVEDFKTGFDKSIRYIRLSLFLFLIFSISMVFIEDIFSLLRVEMFVLARPILIFYLIIILLEMHHGMHAQIYMGTNRVPFLVPSLLSGGLIVAISSYVASEFGVIAILIVQFLVQLMFNNWYSVHLNLKLSGGNFHNYIYRLLMTDVK